MDVRALSSVTDFFVICTGGSSRQLEALKEHIDATLAQRNWPVWHIEGAVASQGGGHVSQEDPQWILMDFGDLVVHLLDQRGRSLYRLEELWADAPRLPLEREPRSAPAP